MFNKNSPLRVDRSMLPPNFAQQVLDLETEVDFRPSMNKVTHLMQLYSRAIEYYESVKDPKYLHYQERLQNMLSKKEVMRVLQTGESPSHSVESKKRSMVHRQRQRAQNISEGSISEVIKVRDAEETLNTFIHNSSDVTSKVRENLKVQEDFSKRLEARKRASSQQPKRKAKLDQYQTEVEAIMERYVEDKLSKTNEIKKKYRELTCQEGISQEEIDSFDRQMMTEIDEMTAQLNKERKEHLDGLKSRLS